MAEERKLYPLTQAQGMLFLSWKYSYKKAIVNICSMVCFETEIDHKLMLQATYLGFARNEAASGRLCKVGKEYMQYFSNEAPDKIEVVDFSGKSEEEFQAALTKWNETPFPNKHIDTQLYVAKLVKQPNGFWALYLCVSHLVFDAYSIMSTVKDIFTIYACLRDGKPMPKPLPSCLPAYEDDFAYQKSEKYQKDLDFFMNEVFDTETMFTTPNGKGAKECMEGKRIGVTLRIWQIKAKHMNLRIPKAINDKVNAFAMERRISPQSLYLLAFRTFLMQENDTEDLMFMNTVARRATLAQKRAGGTMVHAIPFRSNIPRGTSFEDAAVQMSQLQSKYYRHANIAPTAVIEKTSAKFGAKPGTGYHTISVTYQPYFSLDDDTIPCHFMRLPNGAATMPLYVTIMPVDNSGDLMCNYEYICNFIKEESIEKFHKFMLHFLDEGTSHPDVPADKL